MADLGANPTRPLTKRRIFVSTISFYVDQELKPKVIKTISSSSEFSQPCNFDVFFTQERERGNKGAISAMLTCDCPRCRLSMSY